jgi:hypothetical protein
MSPPMLWLRGGVEPHPVGSPAGVKITEADRQPAAPSPPGYSNGNVSYSARAFVRTGVDMSSNVVRNAFGPRWPGTQACSQFSSCA